MRESRKHPFQRSPASWKPVQESSGRSWTWTMTGGSAVAHSATSGACPSGERTEKREIASREREQTSGGDCLGAGGAQLWPSGFGAASAFDARGCSVLTSLSSGVGSSEQQGGGGQVLVPVGRGGLVASSGIWLLRAESQAGAVQLRWRQLRRARASARLQRRRASTLEC
jgi:hypothetical protein